MGTLINLSLLRKNKNFRYLYAGQFISFFGTMITSVALPYQVYHQTNSTLAVGLISLLQLFPLLFTALVGGVLADRRHRKKLLVITEVLLAIGCILLAINAAAVSPSLVALYIIAIAMSATNGLHRPAFDSIMQQIVPREDFPLASPLLSLKFSVGMIAGPALGGLIIAHQGLVVTYLVDFFSFVISLATLFALKQVSTPDFSSEVSAFSSLKQGVSYAFSRQELVGSYFVDFIAMIFGMPMALFPAIAQAHGGAKVLGMLYSAPAVGSLVLSLFSGWTRHIKRYGLAIAISASLWGVAIIFFGLASSLWVSLFFLALAGAFDSASGIFRQVLWNETIPNSYRGRLSGIEMISYMSGPKLGDAEAGLVAAAFGITASIVSGGVLCVVGVAICCYCLPKFYRYRSEG